MNYGECNHSAVNACKALFFSFHAAHLFKATFYWVLMARRNSCIMQYASYDWKCRQFRALHFRKYLSPSSTGKSLMKNHNHIENRFDTQRNLHWIAFACVVEILFSNLQPHFELQFNFRWRSSGTGEGSQHCTLSRCNDNNYHKIHLVVFPCTAFPVRAVSAFWHTYALLVVRARTSGASFWLI